MPIVFLALQCFQCSTMQVKQQKKSSNKWVCVVCNQRQSVQLVHARGFLASDLRKFVQAFNMSRATPPPRSAAGLGADAGGGRDLDPFVASGSLSSASGQTKRTNWTEYLDPEDGEGEEGGGNDSGGGRVVTEWSWKKFEPPIPKCPRMARPAAKEDMLFKPSISKKRREVQARQTESSGSKKCARTAVGGGGRQSRWSEYLGDGDDGFGEDGSSSVCDSYENWSAKSDGFGEINVEEEVHPDFK